MKARLGDRLFASPGRLTLTWTLAVALVVLVVSTILALGSDRYAWEVRVTEALVDLPDWCTTVLRIAMQGGNRLTVAAIALLYLIADRPRRAALVLLAGWGAWLAATLAKLAVGRPRPSAEVLGFSPSESVSGNGFPSSHAAVVFAVAVVVFTSPRAPRWAKVAMAVIAVLTAVARVHLAVHWPLDVIGGAALGVLVGGVVVAILDPAPVPDAWPGVGRWPEVVDTAARMLPAGSPPCPLRLATFNVRNGRALDGRHSWPFRRRAAVDTLIALDAEVLALQEVYAFQRRWLADRLPGLHWVGVGRLDGRGRGEQCPIAWDPERHHLEHWEVRWFGDHPQQAGVRLPGARFPRIATVAWFQDRASGERFGVVNTHFDEESRANREHSARLVVDWVTDQDRPWVVLGDLNDEPDSEPLEVLAASGLRRVAPDPDLGTSHDFTGRTDGPRIDHALVTEHWRTSADAQVVTDGSDRLPSDHWPVVLDLA